MPPSKKRNEFVFLVDVQANIGFVRDTLDKIITYKCLHGSAKVTNDLFRLVLINYPKAPDNYVLCNETSLPMGDDSLFKLLDTFMEMKEDTQVQCDWINAAHYGCQLFEDMCDNKYIMSFVLVIISDFVTVSNSELQPWIDNLLEMDIRVIAVIDQDVTYEIEQSIQVQADVVYAMKGIRIPQSSPAMEAMCQVAGSVAGIVTGPKNVLNFVALMQKKAPMQDWNVNLTVGTYEFQTRTRRILEPKGNLVRKRLAKKEVRYGRRLVDQADGDAVTDASTSAGSLEPVNAEDVVKVRLFHGQPVFIPPDVYKAFKGNSPATFKVLGFIIPSQLSELYYGGEETYAVYPKEDPCAEHFLEFVATMKRLNRLAIAVRIYSKGTAEKLFVLTAQKGWLLMQRLCDGVHKVVEVKEATGKTDESELSPAMLAYRNHLLEMGKKSLFHPQASLNVYNRAVMENLRKIVGFNKEFFREQDVCGEMRGLRNDFNVEELFNTVPEADAKKAVNVAKAEDGADVAAAEEMNDSDSEW